MKQVSKQMSIGKKILYPILFVVLLQILVFWLFIFRLGLFDGVVAQAKNNYSNSSSTNSQIIDSEMWFHFSNLSFFSSTITIMEEEYLNRIQNGEPLKITQSMLNSLVLNSPSIHVDGYYLELDTFGQKDCLHIRFPVDKVLTLNQKNGIDYSRDIFPLFSTYIHNGQDKHSEFRTFLNHLKASNTLSNSKEMYEKGKWSAPLTLDYQKDALVYAIPLNYRNTQYGILGVEIFLSRFKDLLADSVFPSSMPYHALLIHHNEITDEFDLVAEHTESMEAFSREVLEPIVRQEIENMTSDLSDLSDLFEVNIHKKSYLLSIHQLPYASANLAGSSPENFYYVSLSPSEVVMQDADSFIQTFWLLIIILILLSIIIALFITKQVVSPIAALTHAIHSKDMSDAHIELPRTEITEIDLLTDTISMQNDNLHDFHQMLTDTLIATEINIITIYTDTHHDIARGFGTFEALLGKAYTDDYVFKFTLSEFEELMKTIYKNFVPHSSYSTHLNEDTIETEIFYEKELDKYICIKTRNLKYGKTMVMMDYTQYVLEQEKIKKERDYDMLTSLLNRLSFAEKATEYLAKHPEAKVGMVMWDLDFLKRVNDNFGHDKGDEYLQTAGNAIRKLNPNKSYVARVSGDEFFAFLFDYDSKEAMLGEIYHIHAELNRSIITLDQSQQQQLSASCGFVYGKGYSFDELKKYADSAMYLAKKSEKGSIQEYQQE